MPDTPPCTLTSAPPDTATDSSVGAPPDTATDTSIGAPPDTATDTPIGAATGVPTGAPTGFLAAVPIAPATGTSIATTTGAATGTLARPPFDALTGTLADTLTATAADTPPDAATRTPPDTGRNPPTASPADTRPGTLHDAADRSLADQYEAYPYPARDPRDEARRLFVGSPSHLREIDHWVFGAARPASAPLRALIAGCGTGDAAIMLATQLQQAARPGEVVCLDRSERALAIARARAEARGLANIVFHRRSLLDLPADDLGLFDYIDCCGVLHHLPDPPAALRGLERSLAPGGGMGLMVYAPHGRTGVYMLQDALALLAPTDEPPPARLDTAKRVMRHLPATAWLRANQNFGDHLEGGDAGLYDLLLNPRDRAYDIAAFLGLLDQAGLEPACLMEPSRYDPDLLLPDPRLRARTASLSPVERAALAESLAGNMNTHVLYAVRRGAVATPPDPLAPDAVPIAREMPAAEIARQIAPNGTLPVSFGRLVVPIRLPPQAAAILGLIDGKRPVAAIATALATRGIAASRFAAAWADTYRALSRVNRILLRPPA